MFKKLFKRKQNLTVVGGGEGGTGGTLDPSSSTWAFIKGWALSELETARIQNDSMLLDGLKTTALRSRIAVLKEIMELDGSEPVKEYLGLYADDFPDSDTYAGY